MVDDVSPVPEKANPYDWDGHYDLDHYYDRSGIFKSRITLDTIRDVKDNEKILALRIYPKVYLDIFVYAEFIILNNGKFLKKKQVAERLKNQKNSDQYHKIFLTFDRFIEIYSLDKRKWEFSIKTNQLSTKDTTTDTVDSMVMRYLNYTINVADDNYSDFKSLYEVFEKNVIRKFPSGIIRIDDTKYTQNLFREPLDVPVRHTKYNGKEKKEWRSIMILDSTPEYNYFLYKMTLDGQEYFITFEGT